GTLLRRPRAAPAAPPEALPPPAPPPRRDARVPPPPPHPGHRAHPRQRRRPAGDAQLRRLAAHPRPADGPGPLRPRRRRARRAGELTARPTPLATQPPSPVCSGWDRVPLCPGRTEEGWLRMPDRPFVHLHCHTHYSLLDGANRIPELVAHTKKLGMNALAMTDHGNLYGAIEFYRECKAAGLNPVIGYEAYV